MGPGPARHPNRCRDPLPPRRRIRRRIRRRVPRGGRPAVHRDTVAGVHTRLPARARTSVSGGARGYRRRLPMAAVPRAPSRPDRGRGRFGGRLPRRRFRHLPRARRVRPARGPGPLLTDDGSESRARHRVPGGGGRRTAVAGAVATCRRAFHPGSLRSAARARNAAAPGPDPHQRYRILRRRRRHPRWTGAGAGCELRVWRDQMHAFQVLPALVPESRLAYREAARFVSSVLDTTAAAV